MINQSAAHIALHKMIMSEKLETSTEEIAMAYFNELSSNSPRGTEKK
jgi:hypothetical protein